MGPSSRPPLRPSAPAWLTHGPCGNGGQILHRHDRRRTANISVRHRSLACEVTGTRQRGSPPGRGGARSIGGNHEVVCAGCAVVARIFAVHGAVFVHHRRLPGGCDHAAHWRQRSRRDGRALHPAGSGSGTPRVQSTRTAGSRRWTRPAFWGRSRARPTKSTIGGTSPAGTQTLTSGGMGTCCAMASCIRSTIPAPRSHK